jgi:DDE superfamily endonuclease
MLCVVLFINKIEKEAKERDQELRDAWLLKLRQYRADQLVFLDESGLNTKTGVRTHGWAPKGKAIRGKVSGQRAENLSLLPALTVDGYIACKIYEGGVNGPTYEAFLRENVLPKCQEFPKPRSVIIMDNASIHNNPVSTVVTAANTRKPDVLLKQLDAGSNIFPHIRQISTQSSFHSQ